MQKLIEFAAICAHRMVALAFSFLPIRKGLIVICNYEGRGLGDCMAPIVQELLRRNRPWRVVLLVRDQSYEVPAPVEKVKRGWIAEKIVLARAEFILANVKGTLDFVRRRGKYYIQLWHGDMPFKYIEAESESSLSSYYRAMSKIDSGRTDFVVSGSSPFSSIVRKSFWYSSRCKVLEYGNPRKDVFWSVRAEDIANFKLHQFGSSNVRIALVAPTFRTAIPNEACRLDLQQLREHLVQKFGGEWMVVVRLHPNIATRSDIFTIGEKIVNGSLIENGQMLSLAADLLITDYSSIIEDFVLQKKPVFLLVKDLEAYVAHERKLRPLYFRLPFASCRSEDELHRAIDRYDANEYTEKLNEFLDCEYRVFDDGHASERVVDLIERLFNNR